MGDNSAFNNKQNPQHKLLMARQTKQNSDRIPPAPQSFRIKDNKNVNIKQETQGQPLAQGTFKYKEGVCVIVVLSECSINMINKKDFTLYHCCKT